MQPSTATLYDKDAKPLFEFGKRFRTTIRMCPFSSLAMIGGFGNCSGEIDFWDINTMKQVGKAKSHCAVGQEWGPNGKTLMTSVLHARVKVDNMVTLFNADGRKVLDKPLLCNELHWAQW